ncbi:MAG: hypothetical protein ACMVY4_05475 [Minwuia sp.]|uniref:hypothetical protein n=1 Tax=Minwuia sp. TaxID=2493630 RepID=UPI003A8491FE
MSETIRAIEAQAEFHHQYLLGLELMVAVNEGPDVIGDWMFRLFRRQHEEKFLSSFEKLGLSGLPDAVACARYHVLSNSMGGVPVEYMEESDTKAWVRFRYPRWMYDGPALCGVPVEASRGFLRGWYAQNGVSLNNPRLGFVCVSEDMTGQFGLCGYFMEYDRDLDESERLRFAPDETPPPFDPDAQPAPPDDQWNAERLARANRNYAVEYIRNGVRELVGVTGRDRALELAKKAARLTGLQNWRHMAGALGFPDGGPEESARLLASMFEGMGDEAAVEIAGGQRYGAPDRSPDRARADAGRAR